MPALPANSPCLRQGLRIALGAILATAAVSAWPGAIIAGAVDRDGAKMPDVVVYATPVGRPAPPPPATPKTLSITQENMQFAPYVTAVRVGTSIDFPNFDKIEHHVKSFSPAKEFELKIYDKGTPPPVSFDKPGVVIIYCLLHGWMRAYVNVLDTPYFSLTDTASGTTRLNGLPDGAYEVRAWHPDMGTVKPALLQTVTVGADNISLKFAFDFVPRKRRDVKR